MTLPSSGALSFSQVNTELSKTATSTISLNDAAVRKLAGLPTIYSAISFNSLRGKSAHTQPVMNYWTEPRTYTFGTTGNTIWASMEFDVDVGTTTIDGFITVNTGGSEAVTDFSPTLPRQFTYATLGAPRDLDVKLLSKTTNSNILYATDMAVGTWLNTEDVPSISAQITSTYYSALITYSFQFRDAVTLVDLGIANMRFYLSTNIS